MKTRISRISVDGRKRIKIKWMTENVAGTCICSMCIEFNRHVTTAILSFSTFFSVDSRKRIKTKCGCESIDAFKFSMTTKTHSRGSSVNKAITVVQNKLIAKTVSMSVTR